MDEIRYELVIEGEIEVIPGPLSQIRVIAQNGLAVLDCPEEARRKLVSILNVIDGDQP